MTTQTETTEQPTEPKPREVFFEITTLDGAIYRQGKPAPAGTVTTDSGTNLPVIVQSYEPTGDWIEIHLSDGYSVAIAEGRIDRAVTRTV